MSEAMNSKDTRILELQSDNAHLRGEKKRHRIEDHKLKPLYRTAATIDYAIEDRNEFLDEVVSGIGEPDASGKEDAVAGSQ